MAARSVVVDVATRHRLSARRQATERACAMAQRDIACAGRRGMRRRRRSGRGRTERALGDPVLELCDEVVELVQRELGVVLAQRRQHEVELVVQVEADVHQRL